MIGGMEKAIYDFMVGSVIRSLYTEVMVIGIFVVGLGYVRRALSDGNFHRLHGFWIRLVLTLDVMLFVSYGVLSYELDTPLQDFPSGLSLGPQTNLSVKIRVLTILPVDFILVGLTGLMFLVLSRDLVSGCVDTRPSDLCVHKDLRILFFLTGLWHLFCIGWWLLWKTNNEVFEWYHVYIHLGYFAAYLIMFIGWRATLETQLYKKNRDILEWLATATYSAFVISVFILRLGWYIDEAIRKIDPGSS